MLTRIGCAIDYGLVSNKLDYTAEVRYLGQNSMCIIYYKCNIYNQFPINLFFSLQRSLTCQYLLLHFSTLGIFYADVYCNI